MTTIFSTFPGPQPQGPIQFISYKGPPKGTPRRAPSKKVLPSKDEFPDIDTILGIEPDPNSERENRKEDAQTAHAVEVFDLVCSTDNETNCEVSGGRGNNDVGSDDPMNEQEDSSMPNSQEDTRDSTSRQPGPSKGSSQGNAVVIDDSQSDSETDLSDANEEDPGLHIVDRPQCPCTSTPAYHDREDPTGTIDTINSETVDGAKAQASQLPHQRLSITPPTSPPANKAESKIHRLHSIQNTSNGSSSARIGTDDDDHGGNHATQTCKRKRPPLANSASRKRQSRGSNTTLKPSTTRTLASARRQKLFPTQKKAISSSLSKARLASAAQASVCDTEMSCSEDSSVEGSDGSGDWGRHLQKERKPIKTNQGSGWYSQSNSENSWSTHAQPHANQEMRRSVKGESSRQTQWRLSDIALHSLSDDVSFLTAIFRARSDPGVLSSSQAVTLLKSTVGDPTRLEHITFKLLAPGTWFLTSFAYFVTGAAGCGMGQQLSAPSGCLPLNKVDTAPIRDCARPRDDDDGDDGDDGNDDDDVDDETLDVDYNQNSNNGEDYLSDAVVDKPPSSRSRIRWSDVDDDRLRKLKKEGKSWSWICDQFPGRSPGAVQVRWHTKLRGKA